MRLGDYVRMSTQNPTGWRPWNSRLNFYIENKFPLPTASRGPWLLTPGVCDCVRPTVAGGLGIDFPNYPGIGARGTWLTHGGYPAPIYRPPKPPQLSALGIAPVGPVRTATGIDTRRGLFTPGLQVHRGPITITSATPSGTAVAQSNGSTSVATGTARGWQGRRGRRNRSQGGQYNPTQAPGYVVGSDASGNPIYAQPPTGQIVTGYDAQGNPVYGPATSTVGTGGVTQGPAGTIIGYDASGNPIYPGDTTTTPATSWFSEDSLGLGLNNGVYTVAGLALAYLFSQRGRR